MRSTLLPGTRVKHLAGALEPCLFPPRRRGKKRGRGRGSAAKDSPAVVAMLGREQGLLVLAVVPDMKRESLEPPMTQTIARGSTVYTDSAKCYNFLEEVGYHHESVNHSQGEYVRGQVHENGTEGIWSLLLPWLATFRGVNQDNLPAFGRSQLVLQHLLEENTWHLTETWQWPVEARTTLAVHAIPI